MTEQELKLRRVMYARDLAELADLPAGKRVFSVLFEDCRCLQPITEKSADVYRQTGVQSFGLRLWQDLHAANPEASMQIFDYLMSPVPIEENEDGTD